MPALVRKARPRHAGYLAAGLAWLAIAFVALSGDGNPNAACAASVYRDPVTGRLAGMGDVRPLGDGRVLCPRPSKGG